MTSNLNFEAEPFNGLSSPHESSEEYEFPRDHRIEGIGAVHGQPAARPVVGRPGMVHGPAWRGATAVSRRVPSFGHAGFGHPGFGHLGFGHAGFGRPGIGIPGIIRGTSRFFHGGPAGASWNRGWLGARPGFRGGWGLRGPGGFLGDHVGFPNGDRFRHDLRRRWPWMSRDWAGAGTAAPGFGDASDPGMGFDPGAPSGPDVSGSGAASSPSADDPQIIAWAQGCLAHIVGGWVPQDGTMSPLTQRAIQMFQTQAQLPSTGTLDDNTLTTLQQACQAAAGAAPTAAPDASAAAAAASNAAPPTAAAPSDPTAGAPAGNGATATPPAAPASTPELETPDFPHEFGEMSGETYETEGPKQSLCLSIPEAPYSDKTFSAVEKSIDVAESIHVAWEIFGPELAGLLGLSVSAVSIAVAAVAGIAAPFLAIGAGYAKGWEKVSKDWSRSGYSWGVVTGASGEKWDLVKERLGQRSPVQNTFDAHAGVVAQKAFNVGLAAGYLCGRDLAWNPNKRKFFWNSIRPRFATDVRAMWHQDVLQFGDRPSSWPQLDWRNFYSQAMVIFIERYLKDPD